MEMCNVYMMVKLSKNCIV